MRTNANQLIEEALTLPPEERAALAACLIASLDEDVDSDAEEAWATEIRRRLREIDEGRVKAIPWDEVRATLTSR